MTLRVLHVHAGTVWGGVETVIETLASVGGPLEHEAALGWDGPVARRFRDVMPVHLASPVRLSRPWTVRRSRAELEYIIAHAGPHVCLFHSTWAVAAWGTVAAQAGVPLVLWHHGRPSQGLQGWLARRRAVARHLAVSDWTAAQVRARWVGAEPDIVRPPRRPVTASHDPSLRPALATSPDAVVLLSAARWEAGKGQMELLNAVSRLPDDTPWVLWFAGAARDDAGRTLEASVRARAEAMGLLARVRFLGHRDDVPQLLAAADVLVQANTGPEAFGLSFVEAMSAGRPIVTTDLGAAREVIGPCGVLTPPGDATALADALARLVGDPAARAALAAGGPARAAQLSDPDEVAHRLSALLHATCGATLRA